jgi:hypothetical protein
MPGIDACGNCTLSIAERVVQEIGSGASSGRRRFQGPSQYVAERLGRPAAKPLDVAGHNVERTRRKARLDEYFSNEQIVR